jgi:hypothetical protein
LGQTKSLHPFNLPQQRRLRCAAFKPNRFLLLAAAAVVWLCCALAGTFSAGNRFALLDVTVFLCCSFHPALLAKVGVIWLYSALLIEGARVGDAVNGWDLDWLLKHGQSKDHFDKGNDAFVSRDHF